MIKYDGQLQNVVFNIEERKRKGRVRKGEKKKYKSCEDIFTFDIEVSSFWIDKDRNIYTYEAGHDSEYWNNLIPMSLPYIWQFSMNDTVYYGREFHEVLRVFDDLPKDASVKIFIHNLSYEFHFLDAILTWDKVFCRVPHKPITAVCKEYPNIEFRCTYMLTRMSLDAWGKQLNVLKKTGWLDYNKLRTPYTKLTKKEESYCEYDLRVLTAGVREYQRTYGHLDQIPLTQTGCVRNVIRPRVNADAEYMRQMHRLVPRNVEEYFRYQSIMSGGYTHANYHYAGQTITADVYGLIRHKDITSSYPVIMVCEKMPMTQFYYYGKKLPPFETFDYMAYIIHVRFESLETKTFNTFLQSSKCSGLNLKYDNGRILSGDNVELWMTEIDMEIIFDTYDFDINKLEVIEVWAAHKDYIPKVFTDYVLDLYHDKTAFKGIEEKADQYVTAKQRINSLAGMCETALLQADVTYDQNKCKWGFKTLEHDRIQKRLDDLKRWFDNRYFSHYAWGCYITNYGRANLWKLIRHCDQDMLYCDTDSIFYIGDYDFTWYDEMITNKLKTACEVMNLDFEKTRPKDKHGIIRPLGILSDEEDCIEFRTLGAKKYCERWKDGTLHLTVSGINKDAVACLNDDINNFADGFNFDKDHEKVRKQMVTYITNMPDVIMPDGYQIKLKRGINMRANGYKIHLTDSYIDLIESAEFDVSEIPEAVFNNLRGQIMRREVKL